jgi:hypothetical protein
MNILSVVVYLSLRIYRFSTKYTLNIKLKNKIKYLIELSKPKRLNRLQIDEIKKYYKEYGVKNLNVEWHQYYSLGCCGFSKDYLPENLFYLNVEEKLNNKLFIHSLTDKNILSKLFPDIRQPKTILKNINGFYFNDSDELLSNEELYTYLKNNEKLVIKPTIDTGGGKNVKMFNTSSYTNHNGKKDLGDLLKSYDENFIIQETVKQHPKMAVLNYSSLNTLRIMTLFEPNQVDILSIVARMGRKGATTDNSSTGGLSCGVDLQGRFNLIGFQNTTGKSFKTSDDGVLFSTMKIPFMDKILEAVVKMHKNIPYFKLISWDIGIDEEENVVLVEYNVKGQDINIHQLNNGPVLRKLIPFVKK